MARLDTEMTRLLGIEHPIMLAGMGGIASKELVAAVSNAGGYGVWGSAVDVKNKGPEELRRELAEIRDLCGGRPFGIDILVAGGGGGVMKELIDIFAECGATAFISGKGYPRREIIDAFHARGMLVGSLAGRVSHAVKAVDEGVDFVIAQGTEGGGHTGPVATSVLVPQVVDAVRGRVPVVAAGGIYDGRGVAAALTLGASAAWVGTRFMMTPEAKTTEAYKQRLLEANSEDTVITRAFTGSPLRALRNSYTDHFQNNPEDLAKPSSMQTVRALKDGVWALHSDMDVGPDTDKERQAYVTGQCIGAIETLEPAGDLLRRMSTEALSILDGTTSTFRVVGGKSRL